MNCKIVNRAIDLILFVVFCLDLCEASPNIVFVMMDDVGFADTGFSNPKDSLMRTPFMDNLVATEGIKLNWYYVHPTCTPTRASFLTGRYALNSGVPFAVLPGSPVGIPKDVPVLAEALRAQANYDSHIVGKWHVGYGYWHQLPVGRGFTSYTGSLDIDIDSWTKQMHMTPYDHGSIDWMTAHVNGSYSHFAEPRHPTEALTSEAERIMKRHAERSEVDIEQPPLFLYVSFPAPHSPCQPMPRHIEPCQHIPHKWRRDFCGMMVGVDEAIQNLTHAIKTTLGEDAILIVSSDNGGSPWNGGMNQPLRGGKFSAWEGGVRVPGFVVDFSPDKKYFGPGGRVFEGLVHVSDWFPTLLGLADDPNSHRDKYSDQLDGLDVSTAIRTDTASPRNSVLSELYDVGDKVHAAMWAVGYRKGKYKLVEGLFEDLSHCSESSIAGLNCTKTPSSLANIVAYIGEIVFQWAEYFYGHAEFDSVKGALLLAHIQRINLEGQGNGSTYLYDLEIDPEERFNLANELPEVVTELRQEVDLLRQAKPEQGRYWMVLPIAEQKARYVSGDCSMNPLIKSEAECVFKHPFMKDGEEIEKYVDGDDGKHRGGAEHLEGDSVFVHAIPEFTRHMVMSFVYAGTKKLVRVMMVLGGLNVVRKMFVVSPTRHRHQKKQFTKAKVG